LHRPALLQATKPGPGSLRQASGGVPTLDLVNLPALMALTSGRPDIVVGLIDGPIARDHPDLAVDRIREIPGALDSACSRADSAACRHGTFVAGILSAKRGSSAPAICPGCTLLVRPIFSESSSADGLPGATPETLTEAIVDCVRGGARVLNISAAITQPLVRAGRALEDALREAARRGVIVVAAAGNRATLGGTSITSDPWVIPVVAYDAAGRPLAQSNLGVSIGRRGVGAPGHRISSLGAPGKPLVSGGTSAAAAFVTGTIALLWSQFPHASSAALKLSVTSGSGQRRTTVVPPLLNAWAAYCALSVTQRR
jgi:subtilisin family serine protease